MDVKSKFVPAVLIGGLVIAGGGSVLAASGGSSSNGSSAQAQYCPPNSPNAGQPQGGPGNNCGKPPETCPNGQPKPPPGNCGKGNNVASGQSENKSARFKVKRKPERRCYSNKFTLDVQVANMGKGRKVTVYRDGHKVKTTGRTHFRLNLDVSDLKPGVHKLKLRVKGGDGKTHTRTIKFRRC